MELLPAAAPTMPMPQLVESAAACEAGVAELAAAAAAGPAVASGVPLGLDTEWAAGGAVVVLQLCTVAHCLVIRVDRVDPPSPALAALLLDRRFIKAGVGVAEDLRLLSEQFGLAAEGFVDLSRLAQRLGLAAGGASIGLAALAERCLGHRLLKDPAVRCGDWAAEALSAAQLEYAARDAWAGCAVLAALHAAGGPGQG